jgi:hypothetical protein
MVSRFEESIPLLAKDTHGDGFGASDYAMIGVRGDG